MARKQKSYSEAFKRELVALYEAGDWSARSLEREYDVGRGNLYRWTKQYGSAADAPAPHSDAEMSDQERIRELERDILKAFAIFAHPKRNGASS